MVSHAQLSPVVVITGASQGIGRRTAETLNALGWALVLIDLQTIELSDYKNAIAFTGDITDEKFVATIATESVEKFGRIDVNLTSGKFMQQEFLHFNDFYHFPTGRTLKTSHPVISTFRLLPYYEFSTNNYFFFDIL